MSKEDEKRKRAAKTTYRQYEIYVEELETNTAFRQNTMTDKGSSEVWKRLTERLNSVGPSRNKQGWKRVFIDWKSQVKKKARILRLQSDEDPLIKRKLSDLEERLIKCVGQAAMHGMGWLEIGEEKDYGESDHTPCMDLNNKSYIENFLCNNTEIIVTGPTENEENRREIFKEKEENVAINTETISENEKAVSSIVHSEIIKELRELKDAMREQTEELRKCNRIKLMRTKIEYEVAKQTYHNIKLEWDESLT